MCSHFDGEQNAFLHLFFPSGTGRTVAIRLRIIAPDGSSSERLLTDAVVRLGRDPSCEVAFDSDAYPMVSGRHARIEQTAKGCFLTPLSQSNKTLLNDQPMEGAAAVKAGDRIRLGITGPAIEIAAIAPRAETPKPTAAEGFGATVQAGPQHLAAGARQRERGTAPDRRGRYYRTRERAGRVSARTFPRLAPACSPYRERNPGLLA